MSIRVMTRVWDQADAAGGELLVLLALADFADDEGYCYPKEQQIATKARISERQVRNVIKSLEARGELAYQTGRGRNARSWYVVLSGLPDDQRAARVLALQDQEKRKIFPEKTSALHAKNRKPIPEVTSAFETKTGNLAQLKPEICDISTGDLSHSDGTNDDPNRHVIRHDPPPPAAEPPAQGGGGGAKTPPTPAPEGAQYLAQLGFSSWAVRTFGHLPVEVLRPDVERRRAQGQQLGGIVNAWKVCPPGAPPPRSAAPPAPVSASAIASAPIDPKAREYWLRRFRAEGADRGAVLAAFYQEYPDVRPPARPAAAVRPGQRARDPGGPAAGS